jgi:hypothetical protein
VASAEASNRPSPNEFDQLSKLPKYLSSVQSLTNEDCILEHHCTKCIEKDQNGLEDCHLERECSNDEKVVTKKQEIKICNPILDKVCPKNPCKTCPMFCRPNKQIWCEDDFQVRLFDILSYHIICPKNNIISFIYHIVKKII